MRIKKVAHCLVRVPFSETIHWGSGARAGTTRPHCRIETEGGIEGWGETQCLIDSVPAAFRAVTDIVEGYPVCDVERLHRHVLGAGYYHRKRAAVMATAALEMAMWDAFGKITKQPLWALWGGAWRHEVRAAAYTFTRDPTDLAKRLGQLIDAGHSSFKVKIGFDAASDIALAEAARTAIGNTELRLGVNGAWAPGTAKRQPSKLAAFDPAYVEQPLELSDLSGTALLRSAQSVPIALDESAYTLQDVSQILQAQAADFILLDPHQAGGLWQVIKAAALCEAQGIPVGLHSAGELAVSQAAYIHLASAIPNLSLAIDTERAYLGGDIAHDIPALRNGAFDTLDRPGLGVSVETEMVNQFRVDAITCAYLDADRPDWFPIKPAY